MQITWLSGDWAKRKAAYRGYGADQGGALGTLCDGLSAPACWQGG